MSYIHLINIYICLVLLIQCSHKTLIINVELLFDVQCQDTLVQFIGFLSLQLSSDELLKRLPNIHDLLAVHHIPVEVAFALWRLVYASLISVSSIRTVETCIRFIDIGKF